MDTGQQFLRILAGYIAAALVTKGWLDDSNAQLLAGSLLGLAQVGWWAYWNRKLPAKVS